VKPLNSISLEPCFIQPIREVLSKGSDGLHELQPSNHEVQPIGQSTVLEPNCACEVPMRADSVAIFMVSSIILGFLSSRVHTRPPLFEPVHCLHASLKHESNEGVYTLEYHVRMYRAAVCILPRY
jgi:hypothetical protein